MFTERPQNAARDELTAKQIEELQSAATQNSDSVKALAAQVQTTFEAIESAATDLEKRLERQQKLTVLAVIFGISGCLLSVYVLTGAS
jgi:hypothetical protein